MTPLLEIRHLTLRRGDRVLCRNLELSVEAGQAWGVLGPNGAGKSTLLEVLAGLLEPDAGRVQCLGRPLARWRRRDLARVTGVLFQQEEALLATTLFEAVLAGRHPHLGAWGWEGPEDLDIARKALEALDLEALAERDPATLSGGERQRMEIATLLAQDPRLALLDEPTNHLDPGHQTAVLRLLRRRFRSRDRALVMVLHDINLARAFCDRLLLLRGDGSWRAGPVAETGTPEQLSWLYGCPVRDCAEREGGCLTFL